MGPAVTREAAPSAAASPIERLAGLLQDDLVAVDALIHAGMESPVGVIPNLAAHLVDAGGKRIRPLITLAAAQALGGGDERTRKLAAAVEFIHTATLLHDDVVDESSLRRGKTSANLVWGNSASILVGDFLFARAFNLMVETGDIRVLDLLARASSVIAEGEVMQLSSAHDVEMSRAHYLQIIGAKTAALFAAAARAGALTAQADDARALAFETYGRELGVAFQLVDDALDYDGRAGAMGKNAGDDFREGKLTLPTIIAYESGRPEERDFWKRALHGPRAAEDFAHACALLARHDAIAQTLSAARQHAMAARGALDIIPASAFRDALQDLCGFVVDRAY
ncbi:MAG: polyprenyl synthetase family protein [Alphaproteobacteria bacterium]|nr:polyprenyl synthetase family protein [Alphaproteobacteria bacterium]